MIKFNFESKEVKEWEYCYSWGEAFDYEDQRWESVSCTEEPIFFLKKSNNTMQLQDLYCACANHKPYYEIETNIYKEISKEQFISIVNTIKLLR